MRRPTTLLRLLCWLGLALAVAACDTAGVATPVPTTITVAGSTAMRRVLGDLTTAFSRQHPDVLFAVREGGSTVGEEVLRRGEVDIAASTLLPPEDRADVTPDGLVRTPIGLDGLAVVVHPSNSIEALSLVQLADIFSGRVLSWQALGSDAGDIVLVSREDGSGSRILFEQRVMGDDRVSLTAVVMPSSQDVVEYVAKNPQAIGYVTRAEVVEWLDAVIVAAATPGPGTPPPAPTLPTGTALPPKVKVLAVEGRLPTREAVRGQEYALTQPLYLITRGQPAGRVRQFIDFALSPAGQAIVARYHAPIR